MIRILIPISGKIIPPAAVDALHTFTEIHKSPYGDSFYNTKDISWTHKPEGSLRISDHWNFLSRGDVHCPLAHTDKLVEDNWLLAEYKNGSYHVIEEFGPKVDGYLFQSLSEQDILLGLKLAEQQGIEKAAKWYRKYQIRPTLAKETHTKNKKQLLADISSSRLMPFLKKHHNVKKVVYLNDHDLHLTQKLQFIYEKGKELASLSPDVLEKDYHAHVMNELPLQSTTEHFFLLINEKWLVTLAEPIHS